MKKRVYIAITLLLAALLVLSACGGNQPEQTSTGPDFEEHNISINLVLGEEAAYITACSLDASKQTQGSVTITELNHYKGEDALPDTSLEKLEGYEWIEVKGESSFGDDNAKEFGANRASVVTDYYDVSYFEDSLALNLSGISRFAVKYNDEEFTDCQFIKIIDNQGWGASRVSTCYYTWYFRVPEGYDGVVIAFLNTGVDWQTGQYIYEILDDNSLLFRVQ